VSCPSHIEEHRKRDLRLKDAKYCFILGGLCWRNPKGLALNCVDEDEAKKLMEELYNELYGGNHVVKIIDHKILRGGYY
jgi:hypothetical protein